jgi:hypothetical protein
MLACHFKVICNDPCTLENISAFSRLTSLKKEVVMIDSLTLLHTNIAEMLK